MLKYSERNGIKDSFSVLHSTGYSLIALQQMNLAHKFPISYWNTAVLSVEAGANEDTETNKNSNYGKVASAIGFMQHECVKVLLPHINKANFGFTPDPEHNAIIFGLRGMNGIGDEVARKIIELRPYDSFEHFLQVHQDPEVKSPVKNNHIVKLIKGGCFDAIENKSREELMETYLELTTDLKTNLTMQNLPALIEHNLIPEDYNLYVRFYNFRNYIKSFNPVEIIPNNNPKLKKKIDDKLYKLNAISSDFYLQYFEEDGIIRFDDDDLPIISIKTFEKNYKKKIEPLDKLVKAQELLPALNESLMNIAREKYAEGNISRWEMDSLSFYHNEHELTNLNEEKYGIVNYFDLPEYDEPIGYNYYKGTQFPKFNIVRLAGTVLDRDKTKHTVSLLTVYGVVNIKMYAGAFSHYDKQISVDKENGEGKTVIEKSWFTRGNKIMVAGFRQGNNFKPKVYKNTIYSHTIALIEDVYEDGRVSLKSERYYPED